MVTAVDIDKFQQEINDNYANVINDLISQYEVYKHSLHPNISENIVLLFQSLALAKTEEGGAKFELMSATMSQCLITMRELYVRLLDVYYREIKLLRRNNRLYKQKAVVIENTEIKFKNSTDIKFRALHTKYKKVRRKYRFVLKKHGGDETLLDKQSLDDLADTYNEAKGLLNQYEKYVPRVIGSGYNGPLGVRLLKDVYWLVSFALTVAGLVMFLISKNII